MAKFSYQARNENGRIVSGEIDADSKDMANNILLERGFIPTKVAKKGESGGFGSSDNFLESLKEKMASVKPEEIILFTKQFRTMFKAGVGIVQVFQIIENQTENLKLKKIISQMSQDIKEGAGLYEAFKKHPKIFSPLYCSMVHAGEVSGSLPEVLERLVYIIDHEHKVKSDIKSAMRYPLIVLSFIGIAFVVLLNFVMPKFAKMFLDAKLDLPLPTQICIAANQFMTNYWYICLGIIAGSIFAISTYLKTEQGQYVKDSILLRTPIIGPVMTKAAMSRFSSIFSILQSSGVPILDSMNILSGAIDNAVMSYEFGRISEKLQEGRGISGPLSASKFFPPMVINMVAIGEESGNLEDMLNQVSKHYDTEVEYAVGKLSEAIGPLLTLGLAAVVAFFALAIFIPIWDLTKLAR
ncbi:MAG: type II secretion system F family protein [Desulfobacterales bacterium]|nr:type II secretion system F family protein [Desulfobacterales bacterium]